MLLKHFNPRLNTLNTFNSIPVDIVNSKKLVMLSKPFKITDYFPTNFGSVPLCSWLHFPKKNHILLIKNKNPILL